MTAILEMGILRGSLEISGIKPQLLVACLSNLGVACECEGTLSEISEANQVIMVFDYYRKLDTDMIVYRFSHFKGNKP